MVVVALVGKILMFASFYFVTPAFLSESILKRLLERSLTLITILIAASIWVAALAFFGRTFLEIAGGLGQTVTVAFDRALDPRRPLVDKFFEVVGNLVGGVRSLQGMFVLVVIVTIIGGVLVLLTRGLKDRVIAPLLLWLSESEAGRSKLAVVGGVMYTVGGLIDLLS